MYLPKAAKEEHFRTVMTEIPHSKCWHGPHVSAAGGRTRLNTQTRNGATPTECAERVTTNKRRAVTNGPVAF